jgi:hypothetical protein
VVITVPGDMTVAYQVSAGADDAGEFSSSHRVNGVTMTDASQVWNWTGTTWTQDTWYESPDMRAVIQEVTDRSGWSADNALVVRRKTRKCGVADNHISAQVADRP